MKFVKKNVGTYVYGPYTIQKSGRDFILVKDTSGLMARGTKKHCEEKAREDFGNQPIQQLAKKGWMDITTFRRTLAGSN